MFEECSELHISCKSSLKLQTRSLSWVPSAPTNCALHISVLKWEYGDLRLGIYTAAAPCRGYDVWCWHAGNCSVVVVGAVVLDHPAYDSCCVTRAPPTLSNQLVLAQTISYKYQSRLIPCQFRFDLNQGRGNTTTLTDCRLWGSNPIFITLGMAILSALNTCKPLWVGASITIIFESEHSALASSFSLSNQPSTLHFSLG